MAGMLILLQARDTVLVVSRAISAQDILSIDGMRWIAPFNIEIGHKVARRAQAAGEQVIKHGAPIGSLTVPVRRGDHVHSHNMKSDYIDSHSRHTLGLPR